MAEVWPDQAAGLRRLLAARGPRIVIMAAGCRGLGRTSVVAQLARALSSMGRRVLAVDGNTDVGNLNDRLRAQARFDLAHVLAGDRTLGQVLAPSPYGCTVLLAARGLPRLNEAGGRWLLEQLERLGSAPDFVLVDAPPGSSGLLLSGDSPFQELLLVASPEPSSITRGYALLKRLAWCGAAPMCRLLLCQVADAAQAAAIHRNVADVARRHLGIALPLVGWVPTDPAAGQVLGLGGTTAATRPASSFVRAVDGLAETLLAPMEAGIDRPRGWMPAYGEPPARRRVTAAVG